jgi:hypothetical protein
MQTEVPCVACLREAASAKAGYARVGDEPVMTHCPVVTSSVLCQQKKWGASSLF